MTACFYVCPQTRDVKYGLRSAGMRPRCYHGFLGDPSWRDAWSLHLNVIVAIDELNRHA